MIEFKKGWVGHTGAFLGCVLVGRSIDGDVARAPYLNNPSSNKSKYALQRGSGHVL